MPRVRPEWILLFASNLLPLWMGFSAERSATAEVLIEVLTYMDLERVPLEIVSVAGPLSYVALGVPSPTGLLNEAGREVRRYLWTYPAIAPGAYRLRNLSLSPSDTGLYYVWENLEIEKDATIRIPIPDFKYTLLLQLPEGTESSASYLAAIRRSTDAVLINRFVVNGTGFRKVLFGVKDSDYYVELLPLTEGLPAFASGKFRLNQDQIRPSLTKSEN